MSSSTGYLTVSDVNHTACNSVWLFNGSPHGLQLEASAQGAYAFASNGYQHMAGGLVMSEPSQAHPIFGMEYMTATHPVP